MPMYYHNETLFSEIYLEEITRQTENADVLASLKVLGEYREYADTHNLQSWKESYVHEVLSALGFFAQFKSDHITYLFPMGSSGAENPLSLCYVLLPEDNLDNTTIGRNWAEKIIRALRANDLQWGLLTNGKQWRIYHQDEPTPYETYLEIDLEAILADKAKEAYQIFHKFMKAENFAIHEDGKCQFDRFKQESQDKIDYIEKELANALKQREEGGKGVLSDLCMGYVEELRRRKEGDLDDEGLRKKIYHGAMLYMFRLLFLFYADARRLLSDENHDLLSKVESECRVRHDGIDSGDLTFPIWDSLEHIFVDIDQTYNGGLFSPQESEFTRFLSDTRIGDSYLANVIFNLTTYREKNGQEKPISYRDMSVRHLGTLYEGLLEHKLFIAKEDTEVKVAKSVVQFIPVSQGGKLVIGQYLPVGSVYFAGDPSERKSTGSYYTPEYIVDYIVRNSVGEKLKELKATFLVKEKENLEAFTQAVDEVERSSLASMLEENALEFIRHKVLQLSVLDPAMGSGHFLVNATNLIANSITVLLNEFEIEGQLPSGTAYWRRWVVENCIYGVDLNPLAVELAKLSLWILSMAKDQPLSFLKHHLKCGNSLVGARLDDIGNYPFTSNKNEAGQISLFERDPDYKAAVEKAILRSQMIASQSSSVRHEVEEKKVWLDEIEQILAGYKAICNVHTGLFFNNTAVSENQYKMMVDRKDFSLAFSLEKDSQYFNWELEFPLIFMNQNGFNCVIGNPPYLFTRNEGIVKAEKDYFYSAFKTQSDQLNTFCLFLEQCFHILRENGALGFITPNNWLTISSFSSLRKFLLESANNIKIANVLEKVFESANVDSAILIFSKGREYSDNVSMVELQNGQEVFSVLTNSSTFVSPMFIFNISMLKNKGSSDLIEHIENEAKPLSNFCIVSTGLKAYQTGKGKPPQGDGDKKDRVYHSNRKLDNTYERYLEGRDVKRYQLTWSGQYLSYGNWLAEPRRSVPFDGERILVRQIPSKPPFMVLGTLVNEKYYNDINSMVVFSPMKGVSLKFILGVINSRLISYWFQKKYDKLQRTIFPQFKVNELGSFPIVYDSNNQSHQQIKTHIEVLVSKMLELLSVENIIIGEAENANVFEDVRYINLELDRLIYKLYNLSTKDIEEIEKD
ncbi:Eco57I restriction-modification methylase domain-containing protein [Leptolinea tardivitalis]|uniref:site-specific DNA-methyltransferase (adenine-specific) n=1 Tax=Leptolinea tardivitalis TaxID=229920 RepID=A0A0P6XGU0_9CHLR|nr:TaqI-like C-terminal specificity domain-containing protein [Leptolinea tardivitalis]KPL70310.1 hypothetical protein ADM99_14215 [Leptolinea tardivitalis]GAP21871.1 type I restriction-modification system methyltransferase subunit [Leptolinea tardivitalis]